MVVAPIVLDDGAHRHGAPAEVSRQADFAFQVPLPIADQPFAPLRWRDELERREDLRPPAVLPRQAHARLYGPVCEARLVDPGGRYGGVTGRLVERRGDVRRLRLEGEPIGQAIRNENLRLRTPEPALESVRIRAVMKIAGGVINVVVRGIRKMRKDQPL